MESIRFSGSLRILMQIVVAPMAIRSIHKAKGPRMIERTKRAFTMVELLIVIVIIGILAATLAPQLSNAADDAKIAKIISVADSLRTACQTHYSHTGTLAHEYSGYTEAANHELSMPQTTAGWKGPYIDHPLSKADNPFGQVVHLYESFATHGSGGFDLLGAGSDTVTGAGQVVVFWGVSEELGEDANDIMDEGIAGDWKSTGRVEWASNRLIIYLMDAPN